MISGTIPSFINAFFESTSGFSTTGSSILKNVEISAIFNSFLEEPDSLDRRNRNDRNSDNNSSFHQGHRIPIVYS